MEVEVVVGLADLSSAKKVHFVPLVRSLVLVAAPNLRRLNEVATTFARLITQKITRPEGPSQTV